MRRLAVGLRRCQLPLEVCRPALQRAHVRLLLGQARAQLQVGGLQAPPLDVLQVAGGLERRGAPLGVDEPALGGQPLALLALQRGRGLFVCGLVVLWGDSEVRGQGVSVQE